MAGPRTARLIPRGPARATSLRAAGVLLVCAAVVYVGAEAVSAAGFPGYSYARNYISDLGVPETGLHDGRYLDSSLSGVMNAGFVIQGLLFFLAALLAARARHRTRPATVLWVSLAALHAVGITLVAVVHGGPLSAASGIIGIHVAGAALAIVCGNLASIAGGVVVGGRAFRVFSVMIAVAGLLFLVGLQTHPSIAGVSPPDGVWERGSVYAITVWELVAGIVLVVSSRRARSSAM